MLVLYAVLCMKYNNVNVNVLQHFRTLNSKPNFIYKQFPSNTLNIISYTNIFGLTSKILITNAYNKSFDLLTLIKVKHIKLCFLKKFG